MQMTASKKIFSRAEALPSPVTLGDVELISIATRKPDMIAHMGGICTARSDKVALIFAEHGQVSIAQNGRLMSLREGQYAIYDCRWPMRFSGNDETGLMVILSPSFQLQSRLRNLPRMLAQPFPCEDLPWRVAKGLLKTLVNEIRFVPAQLAYSYANQVIETVSVAIEADSHDIFGTSGRSALFKRCAAYIKSHISDSQLDPNKISDAMGISVRYLHKVFQESGETVCEYLRTTRLEIAKTELADPQKSALQIREIAHRVGFRSQAHFAAAFKNRFGVSASEWRKCGALSANLN